MNLLGIGSVIESVGKVASDLITTDKERLELVLRAKELDQAIDLAQIDASDRNSARQREVQLRDKTPLILAAVVCTGFFATLIGLMMYGLPAKGQDAVLILLGALSSAFTAIIGYYYGSSSGSRAKEQIIDQMVNRK